MPRNQRPLNAQGQHMSVEEYKAYIKQRHNEANERYRRAAGRTVRKSPDPTKTHYDKDGNFYTDAEWAAHKKELRQA
jgi:hypothetical protein